MKTLFKFIGYVLLAVLLILLSPLIIVLIAILILGIILYVLISQIFDIPKQKRQKALLQELVAEVVDERKKYAYLWYSRNNVLSDHLENTFIPKYKNSLIAIYGDGYSYNSVPKEYKELLELLNSYSEQGKNTDASYSDDDYPPAILYTFDKTNSIQKKWWAIVNWEENEEDSKIDIERTLQLFEQQMDDAISRNTE